MGDINVTNQTQKIIVDPSTTSVSVINAGPIGPSGPPGGGVLVVDIHSDAGAGFVLTNATQAERFAGGSARHIRLVPITSQTQVRMTGYVLTTSASVNTPKCRLRYKTGAFSATFADYTQLGASGHVEFSVFTGAAGIDTGWIDLAAGALNTDIWIALTELGGDAAADPAIGSLTVYFK